MFSSCRSWTYFMSSPKQIVVSSVRSSQANPIFSAVSTTEKKMSLLLMNLIIDFSNDDFFQLMKEPDWIKYAGFFFYSNV